MTIDSILENLNNAISGEESTMAVGEHNKVRMVQLPLTTLLELMASVEGQYQPEQHETDDRVTAVAAELWNGSAEVRLGLKPSFGLLEDRMDVESALSRGRIAVNTIDQVNTLESQEDLASLPVGSVVKDRTGRALQITPRGLMAVGEEHPILEVRGELSVLSRTPEQFYRVGWLRTPTSAVNTPLSAAA